VSQQSGNDSTSDVRAKRGGGSSRGPRATVVRVTLARWRVASRLKRRINGAADLLTTTREEILQLQSMLQGFHADTSQAEQIRHEELRHWVELTESSADRRLELLAHQVLGLHEQLSAVSAERHIAIGAHLKALGDELDHKLGDQHSEIKRGLSEVATQIEAAQQRLRATQALTSRVYERSHNWAQQVNELRSEPDYDTAFEEAEPLVTVRVATWNRAELLVERALASLLRQTYGHWEAIVIGDACTDDTAERVAALGDPRIYFENLAERGPYPDAPEQLWQVAGTRPSQRAGQLATGRWIAQLDDDDSWDDDHLEVLLAEAARTRAEIVYGKWRWIDTASGQPLGSFGSWPPKLAEITFQAAIEHGHLRRLQHDPNAYLADEPVDWNRARRLFDAGVRFAFLDREVATVYISAKSAEQQASLDAMLADPDVGDQPQIGAAASSTLSSDGSRMPGDTDSRDGRSIGEQLTSAPLWGAFEKLTATRSDLEVLRWSLGSSEAERQWLQSIGVTKEPELAALVPPLPPLELRLITAATEPEVFLWTGFADLTKLLEMFEQHDQLPPGEPRRVLDFGCGCGRMTRFFPQLQDRWIGFGSDINPDHVDWCRDHLPAVITLLNGAAPPIATEDASMDFVYCLSVFSHLPDDQARVWFGELARVIRPGGLLLITTHGIGALDTIAGSKQHQAMFELTPARARKISKQMGGDGYVLEPYRQNVVDLARTADGYGNCFVSEQHIRHHWIEPHFDLCSFLPIGLNHWQDVSIMRRR
jgi:SAM-dependent methyltransferase